MRLIDADALMEIIERSKNCFFNRIDKEIALNYVFDAPTINEKELTQKQIDDYINSAFCREVAGIEEVTIEDLKQAYQDGFEARGIK